MRLPVVFSAALVGARTDTRELVAIVQVCCRTPTERATFPSDERCGAQNGPKAGRGSFTIPLGDNAARYKTMTIATDEFIRRFLLHVHPRGLHRIRHYGLLANHQRVNALAQAHALLDAATPPGTTQERTGATGSCPHFCLPRL